MTVILLSADDFDTSLSKVAYRVGLSQDPVESVWAAKPVRRPYRGIQLEGDTYASLQVYRPDGTKMAMIDGGARADESLASGASYVYTNFVMQDVQETREEKVQILDTFGDPFGFFYGQRPRFVTVSGALVDTPDFNWKSEWWFNYENSLRGTQLVKEGARAYLSFKKTILEGYLINSSVQQNSMAPNEARFSFTMWVTGDKDISRLGFREFPPAGSVAALDDAWSWHEAAQTYGSTSAVPTGLKVRQANLDYLLTYKKVDSLTDVLTTALEAVSSVLNAVSTGLDFVQNIMMGKSVRLPLGYAGSELLTQANELASGTYDASTFGTISSLSKSLRLLPTHQIPGNLSSWERSIPLRGHIWNYNWDEYAQGGNVPYSSDADVGDPSRAAIAEREMLSQDLQLRADAALAEFGINENMFPGDDVLLLARAGYGAIQIGASVGFVASAQATPAYLSSVAADRDAYYTQSAGEFNPDP